MVDVTLEPAGPARREMLENLFQLYVHDFSEQWFDRAMGELDETGRFAAYIDPARYWTEPGCSAWLIRADGHLAGFALLDVESHSGRPVDHDMAEFFVARKYRRAGVGYTAACRLISERPGLWEIAVTRRNPGAQAFWRRVAAAVAVPETEVASSDQNDERWNGLILRVQVSHLAQA